MHRYLFLALFFIFFSCFKSDIAIATWTHVAVIDNFTNINFYPIVTNSASKVFFGLINTNRTCEVLNGLCLKKDAIQSLLMVKTENSYRFSSAIQGFFAIICNQRFLCKANKYYTCHRLNAIVDHPVRLKEHT